jgi:hypothetical protein
MPPLELLELNKLLELVQLLLSQLVLDVKKLMENICIGLPMELQ